MIATTTNKQRDMKNEFINITLLLVSLALWCLIVLGDILPGSLPNIIMFDAVIMIAICGISYLIKSRSFNFACFFFQFCITLLAVQITLSNTFAPALYLIPACLVIVVILLPLPWILLAILLDSFLILAFAPSHDGAFLFLLMAAHLIVVGLLKRYFLIELAISQNFQDYAAEQMREARESRAKLVLISKQLQEYQERLRQTNKKLEIAFEQAEESRELKARFAANVSHELRTPINLIVGFSEVMILAPEVYNQPLPSPYRADIHAIYRNAKHLQNLINDVLDISQLEARHLAIVKQKSNLRDCVRETAKMVEDLIEKKGLSFSLDMPDDLPDLWFDPVRIRQILLNLLVNSVRFTSTGSITIDIKVGDNQVITSVIDTGIGLNETDIKHVFEEFYQVDDGNLYLDRGSGLGLTVSRELIRLHDGEMTVSSAGMPGQGSKFTFSLPTTKSLVSQMPTSNHVQAKAAPQKRILVVDADEAITSFFTRYLKAHNVVASNNEADALRTLTKFEPDVLLLAHDHDYRHLLKEIQRLNINLNVVTLPMPSGREAIRQRGVAEYLVKPVSRETLNKALAQFGDALRSIMIIDDNRDIVRLFSQTLRSLNTQYQIRSAYSGSDGIALMNQDPPDLLILDVLMPGMDGFAVIETMRAHENLRGIPIVVISAKGASESITHSIHGDITLARSGGYSPIELVTSIQALIDGIRQPVDLRLTRNEAAVASP